MVNGIKKRLEELPLVVKLQDSKLELAPAYPPYFLKGLYIPVKG